MALEFAGDHGLHGLLIQALESLTVVGRRTKLLLKAFYALWVVHLEVEQPCGIHLKHESAHLAHKTLLGAQIEAFLARSISLRCLVDLAMEVTL